MKSLAPLLSVLLISCTSESQRQTRWDAVRKTSVASGICSLHHVPLRRSVVYGWSHFDTGTIDPGPAEYRAQKKYPNSLVYYQQRRLSKDFHHREVAVYFPVCQERFEHDTRR
jgi:hypothetical protein